MSFSRFLAYLLVFNSFLLLLWLVFHFQDVKVYLAGSISPGLLISYAEMINLSQNAHTLKTSIFKKERRNEFLRQKGKFMTFKMTYHINIIIL